MEGSIKRDEIGEHLAPLPRLRFSMYLDVLLLLLLLLFKLHRAALNRLPVGEQPSRTRFTKQGDRVLPLAAFTTSSAHVVRNSALAWTANNEITLTMSFNVAKIVNQDGIVPVSVAAETIMIIMAMIRMCDDTAFFMNGEGDAGESDYGDV